MKNILTIILLVLATGISSKGYATAQYPDKLIYNGKEYSMHTNPLEAYFEKFPQKRPTGGVQSTALWRGYIATFEIRDNQLYLKDIQIQIWDTTSGKKYETAWKSVLSVVFPDSPAVKIGWLKGLLVLPYGKLVSYVHMGYASTYENYILLEIDNGNFVKEKKLDYKEYTKFKDRQFEAFRKTDEYRKLKEDIMKNGKSSEEFANQFLKEYVIEYSSRILVDQ